MIFLDQNLSQFECVQCGLLLDAQLSGIPEDEIFSDSFNNVTKVQSFQFKNDELRPSKITTAIDKQLIAESRGITHDRILKVRTDGGWFRTRQN